MAKLRLDEIGAEQTAEYTSERQRDGLQISSINSCLRCLRRVLKLAEEWGVLTKAPRIKFLPGEHCRERVLTPQEEQLYLAAAAPLLHDVSACWPAETQSGHVNHDSFKRQHRNALRLSKVRPFEVYSIRHTFATRLAPHVDVWTLCRVMGWASLSIGMRYVHPSEDRVLAAFEPGPQLSQGGDKSGDSAALVLQLAESSPILTS